jgi:hypothetical protein
VGEDLSNHRGINDGGDDLQAAPAVWAVFDMATSCATRGSATRKKISDSRPAVFAQCRIYSKYLALQIKACETGLLPLELPVAYGELKGTPALASVA